MENITLIGMPGAGKSTLGVVLAKKLGMRFVDTDLLIQEGSNQLLSEIIAERGAEGFIAYEDAILAGLECEGHVIATGGSACYGENGMKHLSEISRMVFIDIDRNELRRRLGPDLVARGVVMRNGDSLDDLWAERRPLYLKYAQITVETNGLSTMQAVEELCRAL